MTSYSEIYDAAGLQLPNSTPEVPASPSQTLPFGFDSSVIAQLANPHTRMDWSGNIVLVGIAAAVPVDLGGGPLAPLGSSDIVLAKFDPSGVHLWSHRFEANGADVGLVANFFGASDGSVFVTGTYSSADFGWGPLTQSGSARYVAKLDGEGTPICARAVVATDMMTGPAGELVLANDFAPIQIGTTTLGSSYPFACGPNVTYYTYFSFARLAP